MLSQNQVIEQFKIKHGDYYDYSLVGYVNSRTPVKIICPEHGLFEQRPSVHKQGRGCPSCSKSKVRTVKNKAANLEEFLALATAKHGDRYDYSRVVFSGMNKPVEIICKQHGATPQTPLWHLQRSGCKQCGVEQRSNAWHNAHETRFIERATEIHQGRYDYSRVNYTHARTKVDIICPEHGLFQQTPNQHLSGHGCRLCGNAKGWEDRRIKFTEFVERSREYHGDKYEYDESSYVKSGAKVRIKCHEHGWFEQTANAHASGSGCYKCSKRRAAQAITLTTEEFVARSRALHGELYDYGETEYVDCTTPVKIKCSTHGYFMQRPDVHARGGGCQACAFNSTLEDEVYRFVKTLVEPDKISLQQKVSFGSIKKYVDLAVKSLGVCVDVNGIYWHSEASRYHRNYHLLKSKLAAANGMHLIHIFEDEWVHNRPVVEHLLTYALGKLPTVMARKTSVVEVEHKTARDFYRRYHLQGASVASGQTHYGLQCQGELVAVMSFTDHLSGRRIARNGEWELIRFASKYAVAGGASKLFKHFVRTHNPDSVLSFSWNHVFDGKLYSTLGFKEDAKLEPDYMYVDKSRLKRLHKSGFQHSKLRVKFKDTYDPNKTERENCEAHGLFRIWDCGKTRWLWQK